MTGETAIMGKVLPVGCIQQRPFAADETGVKVILIPKDTLPNIDTLAAAVKEKLTITSARRLEEAFKAALGEHTRGQPRRFPEMPVMSLA
jgi:ATP-dependent Lon protease